MCPHTTRCVLILLDVCPHTTICVLIPLYVSAFFRMLDDSWMTAGLHEYTSLVVREDTSLVVREDASLVVREDTCWRAAG